MFLLPIFWHRNSRHFEGILPDQVRLEIRTSLKRRVLRLQKTALQETWDVRDIAVAGGANLSDLVSWPPGNFLPQIVKNTGGWARLGYGRVD